VYYRLSCMRLFIKSLLIIYKPKQIKHEKSIIVIDVCPIHWNGPNKQCIEYIQGIPDAW
jgi:hypothetical protein